MLVPVVEIGVVRVPVAQGLMPVPMRVRLSRRVAGPMDVMMVVIMGVGVLVLQRLVDVLMLVVLREVQPKT